MIAVTLGEWKTTLDLPTGEIVILHNPKVFTLSTQALSVPLFITCIVWKVTHQLHHLLAD